MCLLTFANVDMAGLNDVSLLLVNQMAIFPLQICTLNKFIESLGVSMSHDHNQKQTNK